MVAIQTYIRAFIIRSVFILTAIFFGTWMTWKLTLKFLRNPFNFFFVKPRPNAPACLKDPRYGEHKYAKINGTTIHYVANGKKGNPLVLFIHGWPECWYSWRNQLVAFAEDYYVVAIDLRGIGLSGKPDSVSAYSGRVIVEDFRALIEHLGYEKANVVGHDWGAGFSYLFAAEHPNMVNKLVVSNFPYGRAGVKWLYTCGLTTWWYFFFYQLPLIPIIAMYYNDMEKVSDEMKHPTQGIPDDSLLSPEDIEAYKYMHSNPSPIESWRIALYYPRAAHSFEALVYRIERTRLTGEKWARIKPKTLMLWGGADQIIPPMFAYETQENCDDATIKVIPGATHWLQQHKPVEYTAALKEFLREK